MSDLSRRRFLAAAAAVGATALLPRRAPAAGRVRPRYVVQLDLLGGFDAVMSVDPKLAGPGIEPGYAEHERLRGRRRFYGPLAKELMRHEADLCLLHGVRVDTVSHVEGTSMLTRGRITASERAPMIGDLVGAALPGSAPIAFLDLVNLDFGTASELGTYVSPGLAVDPDHVEALIDPRRAARERPAWLGRMNEEHRARAALLTNPEQRLQLEARYRELAAVGRFFASAPTTTAVTAPDLGKPLTLALHAIRNNHAKYIRVSTNSLWFDSHTDNVNIQTKRLPPVFRTLAHFIDRLKTERNEFGPLYDQTTIVAGSELGRFPRLNSMAGKDHWPETSFLFCGGGLRVEEGGVTLGATDDRYRGMKVDFSTGSVENGNLRPLYLDSVFATLLALAGANLPAAGFRDDQVLRRILASG